MKRKSGERQIELLQPFKTRDSNWAAAAAARRGTSHTSLQLHSPAALSHSHLLFQVQGVPLIFSRFHKPDSIQLPHLQTLLSACEDTPALHVCAQETHPAAEQPFFGHYFQDIDFLITKNIRQGTAKAAQHKCLQTAAFFLPFFLSSRKSPGLRKHQTTPCQGAALQAGHKRGSLQCSISGSQVACHVLSSSSAGCQAWHNLGEDE